MAQDYISLENLRFLLFDTHHLGELFSTPYYSEYNRESIDMMIDSAKDFADRELFPFFTEMDRQGVNLKNKKVEVHTQVAKILSELGASGWLGATNSFEQGGMQLPNMVAIAIEAIYTAANSSGIGYCMLTNGAARLIQSFGSDELKTKYATKLLQGEWQGTMALTEPQAGSSLSDITTKASRNEDGSFQITGQKIFISGGDYEGVENIVHLMLAKIEDAPTGAKGISLFVVPKKRLLSDGLVENDVSTAGLFHKMGQHGYVTTHLIMGEKDNCKGYLVGDENQGLRYMFQMMNKARIEVGLTGTAIASAAYYASLEYAQERTQGRLPSSKNPLEEPVPIIKHADVRRMLLAQKAMVEGTMSLLIECSKLEDLIQTSESEEQHNYHLLLELLTPIVKAFPTEKGIESVSNGLQCLGGYGYCVDFPLEQLYRDIRITALYEGTTGIQSIDLLGRKMMMSEGKALRLLIAEISTTIDVGLKYDVLKDCCKSLYELLSEYQRTIEHLMKVAKTGKIDLFLSDANLLMELSGILVVGWQWLKQGITATEMLNSGETDSIFMESKVHTMKYYFAYEIPKANALITKLVDDQALTLASDKEYLI